MHHFTLQNSKNKQLGTIKMLLVFCLAVFAIVVQNPNLIASIIELTNYVTSFIG